MRILRFNVFGVAISMASTTAAAMLAASEAAQRDTISKIPNGSVSTYGLVGLIAITSVGSQIAAAREMAKRLREIENQRFSMIKDVVDSSAKAAAANAKLADQVEKLIEQLRSRPCQVSHKKERLNDETA